MEIHNTICSATEKRQTEAEELSKTVDKLIVFGGKNSSNTQKLVEICAKNCGNTVHIETICDLVLNNFGKDDKIGITAGASTPPAIIKEVVVTMSEALENAVQNLGGSEEATFEQMLEESLVTLHTGDVVKGTVIQVVNEEVSVNLGFKSDGIIARGEFSSDPTVVPSKTVQPGDEIEVFVVRVNDGDGNLKLSRKRIEAKKGIEENEEANKKKDYRSRQPFGILHCGATLALAEIVAGRGSMITCQPDEIVVGMQVSGNHISSAHEGDTERAVATIVHKGRSSHVWNVDVFTSTNKLVSSIRGVNSALKKR